MRSREALVPIGAAIAAILLGWWLLRITSGPAEVPPAFVPTPHAPDAKRLPASPPPPPAPEPVPAPAPLPPAPAEPDPPPPPAPEPENLRDWVVRGTVTSKDGAPVGGATVEPLLRDAEVLGIGMRPMAKERLKGLEEFVRPGESGSDGRYEVRLRLPGTAAVNVRVKARGFVAREATIALEEREPDRTADFVLDPAFGIEGRIVEREGFSVRGASVIASSTAGSSTAVKSDSEGRYRISDAPGGDVVVGVQPPPNPRGTWRNTGLRRAARSGDRDVDFVLERLDGFGARVVVEVVEAGAERPSVVKKAGRVSLSDPGQWRNTLLPVPEVIEPGRVTLGGMAAGRWRIWVELDDGRVRFVDVDVADGQTEAKAVLKVGKPGSITGTLDLAGLSFGDSTPAVHIHLAGSFSVPTFVLADHPDHFSTGAVVRKDGTFDCPKLLPGIYVVEIGPGIGLSASARVEVLPGRTAECRLVASRSAKLSLRLTVPDGGGWFDAWTWSGAADPAPLWQRNLKERISEVEVNVHPGPVRWTARYFGRPGADGLMPEPQFLAGTTEAGPGETRVVEVTFPATR